MGWVDLNAREELFCEHYVDTGLKNQIESTLAAGYAESSAAKQARDLMKRPRVRDYIAELVAQKAGRVGYDKDALLKDLLALLKPDASSLSASLIEAEGRLDKLPPEQARSIASFKVRVETTKGIETSEVIEVKMIDRLQTLRQVASHVDVNAVAATRHDHKIGLADDLAERINKGRARLRLVGESHVGDAEEPEPELIEGEGA